ncbi:hypothetical protein BS17DRAFT_177741 [Gyrodon lividus]|nr:hypothetical protein BS17DRAFT_177741 [Gyrodon lividus]
MLGSLTDDDFDAFCALARCSVSVEVQVTVGGSPGSSSSAQLAQPLPKSPQKHQEKEKPPQKSSRRSSEEPSEEPAEQSTPGQPDINRTISDDVDNLLQSSTSKIPETSKKKRKVSFDDGTVSGPSNSPVETPAVKLATKKRKTASEKQTGLSAPLATAIPTVSKGTAEPVPTAPLIEPKAAGEPPKKRQKKERAKDILSAENDEPSGKKVRKKTEDSKKTVEAPPASDIEREEPKSAKATKSVISGGKKKTDSATAGVQEPVKKLKRSKKGDDEKAVCSKKPSGCEC